MDLNFELQITTVISIYEKKIPFKFNYLNNCISTPNYIIDLFDIIFGHRNKIFCSRCLTLTTLNYFFLDHGDRRVLN